MGRKELIRCLIATRVAHVSRKSTGSPVSLIRSAENSPLAAEPPYFIYRLAIYRFLFRAALSLCPPSIFRVAGEL